ncbi:MAG: hypothetical protein AVDCRST_MAG93-7458, partial [uncultured Chloroflexia bacterium]
AEGLVYDEASFHASAASLQGGAAEELMEGLSNHTVLFVGTSMTDPNVRRLQYLWSVLSNEAVDRHHAIILRRDPNRLEALIDMGIDQGTAERILDVFDDMETSFWQQRNVDVIWTHEYGQSSLVLNEILQSVQQGSPFDTARQLRLESYSQTEDRLRPTDPELQATITNFLAGRVDRLRRQYSRLGGPRERWSIGIFVADHQEREAVLWFSSEASARSESESNLDRLRLSFGDNPQGVVGQALHYGTVAVANAGTSETFNSNFLREQAERPDVQRWRSVLAVPIEHPEANFLIGAICLNSSRPDRALDSLDSDKLQAVIQDLQSIFLAVVAEAE